MPIEILMPALSPTMTEGNLVKWTKKEGDTVESGDVIAEIETDKATMEVESVDEGILGKVLVPAGTQNVKVNQLIALLLEEGEEASTLEGYEASAPGPAKTEAPTEKTDKPAEAKSESAPKAEAKPDLSVVSSAAPQSTAPSGERVFATPLAKRIARQSNLDLSVVAGTGPRGRIVKADVETAIAAGGGSAAAARPLATGSVQLSGYEPAHEITEPSMMRKVIAARLQESKQTVPHFYLTVDCEIDAVLAARKRMNENSKGALKLSVNDIVIKAAAMALQQVPAANASWINDQLVQYESADVSVAVTVEGGLITPIVREAHTKGLAQISSEMKDLASRARSNQLQPQEFQGGTFTVSNLGMFGIKDFSAVINPPQACILAVGAGEQRPVVRNGQLEIATIMTCTLSVDHRAVDGAVAAQYLTAFKACIEDPLAMLL